MSSIPTMVASLFIFSPEKLPETSGKAPENLRKIPKKAGNYGNPTVFMRPTNRKHIPLNGQFGLASSDYMYGIQRPEFSQCIAFSPLSQTNQYRVWVNYLVFLLLCGGADM
jgi:hypothetical protein